jgi:hypothetical protein
MEIKNSQWKVVRIWAWLTAVFAAVCFLPSFIDMEGMIKGDIFTVHDVNERITLIRFFAGFFGSFGIIALIFYSKRARQLDGLLKGNDVLARWFFSTEEWLQYAEYDYQEDKSTKTTLFYVITSLSLIIGIVLSIISGDILFLYIMLGLIVILAIAAFGSIYVGRKINLARTGYVLISTKSVLLNGAFHNWTSIGARLENVTYIDNVSPTIIALEYSFLSSSGRQGVAIRIPVPTKEREKVTQIIGEIRRAN